MTETDHRCDFLKPLDSIGEPDTRNAGQMPSFLGGGERKVNYFHERISKYELDADISVEIRVQFETAKNLYLYSWFVFRFFNVAEHQAYITLELGLKELFKDELPDKYKDRFGNTSMKKLLQYAVDMEYIQNGDFTIQKCRSYSRAKARYEQGKIAEMDEKGLSEIVLDDSEIEVLPSDNVEYLEILLKTIPQLRNHYAHGSTSLSESVLHAFEIVSELLNAAYGRVLGR